MEVILLIIFGTSFMGLVAIVIRAYYVKDYSTRHKQKSAPPKYFAIHKGYVTSKNDGDRHYIGFLQLCKCYHLDPKYCIDWNDGGHLNRFEIDYIHLFPRLNGDYKLSHLVYKEDGPDYWGENG